MKRSTFLGSALGVLLLFSVISYSRTYIQRQDPKPVQQPIQQPVQQIAQPVSPSDPQGNSALTPSLTSAESVKQEEKVSGPVAAETATGPASLASPTTERPVEIIAVAAQTYTATAYSLRGRTASGKPVSRGLIAADPSVLPLGTRVRVEAGTFSGEYVVADTGGAVKGRRIDIWTPTAREALQFGRRVVKLTVLEFGGKRAKSTLVRPRLVNAPATQAVLPAKQEK
jgi:3D (Asp-Asp-Asp) domain-containing protein